MTWRWMIAAPLAFLALTSTLSAQSSALDEGVKLIREERFDQALVKLKQAHRLAPRDATVDNLLGITETQLGHLDEACKDYRNAIRLDPSHAASHRNLGFNLLTARDFAGAEPELREASRLDPSDKFAHYYLLLLALATGHDAEAQEQASHIGQLLDNDPETAAGLVEAEIRIGRVDEAASRIERLEEANQIPATRDYQIAILLSQHGFYNQAIHCFTRIVSLDPSWQNRYNLALALLYGGQFAEASTLLATLHTEQPTNADILTSLGSARESQQKMPEALEAYRAAAAADPSNPDRTLDYTRLLMNLDRYDEAIQVVHNRMGETSATAPLELRLGAVEMLKSNYPAARDAFNAALATDPGLDVAYVGLAETYARQDNNAEAIRILEAERSKLPNDYLLEYYFGLLTSRVGRKPEAIVALEKAARIEPRSSDPFYELGKLYEEQEDWPKARQALEHAIELNPQYAHAHYQLSRVYAHLGLTSKADQEATQTRTLIDSQRNEAILKQRERAGSFQPQTTTTSSPNRE
jgi:tetratricopeptide (TPR) repeat protein